MEASDIFKSEFSVVADMKDPRKAVDAISDALRRPKLPLSGSKISCSVDELVELSFTNLLNSLINPS